MKNSTLIRIKVPKALYESALKKALLEATDKATPEKAKASIQKQEKYHNDQTNAMIAKARAAKANTGEKKEKMEEAGLMQAFQYFKELSPFLIPLSAFLGLSVKIVKNMIQYMKDNNLKGMKGFIEAYNVIGKGVSGAADAAKGIQNESKVKVDPKKVAEEKKKKEMEAKKAADKKKADAKKAADKKKVEDAKKK
jgi:hypothetical protein